jgi:K+ transporter
LAYLLRFPNAASSPFFESVPSEVFWPVMVVATMAAIIASQAMISGTFSLISQGMGLGTIPPMTLTHTSKRMHGQVYAPVGNWILMATTLGLILFFQSSSALAAAYGIAVTGTLAITTLIFMAMVVLRWKWSAFVVVPVCLFFFAIEMIYFSANMTKFPNGGWVALLLAAATIIFMGSWKLGQSDVSRAIAAKRHKKTIRDVIRTCAIIARVIVSLSSSSIGTHNRVGVGSECSTHPVHGRFPGRRRRRLRRCAQGGTAAHEGPPLPAHHGDPGGEQDHRPASSQK